MPGKSFEGLGSFKGEPQSLGGALGVTVYFGVQLQCLGGAPGA